MTTQAPIADGPVVHSPVSLPGSWSSYERAIKRLRGARPRTFILTGLSAGLLWGALIGARLPGEVRIASIGIPIAVCSLLYLRRGQRPAHVPPAPVFPPDAVPTPRLPDSGRRNGSAEEARDFVPLAQYWVEPRRARELADFLAAVDDVRLQLEATFEFIFGAAAVASISIQELDVTAAELGIWSWVDSQRWRTCLQLRRDIMSEGGVPATAGHLREQSVQLEAVSRTLRDWETSSIRTTS